MGGDLDDDKSLGLSTLSELSSAVRTTPKELRLVSCNTNWLCGRTKETLTLLKTYQTILQNRNEALSKAVLVVHGESGTGKTSLVESSLRDPVSESNGYFCAGKFVQQSKGDGPLLVTQEPYSAIMAAFPDLCDLVLQYSDFDNLRRKEVQQALGTDASLLVGAISNLSPFLDANHDTQFGLFDTINKTILARFKLACKRFLRAMSSDRHPVVLFIDDIQWMDDGSRQLIEALILDDDELRNVLLIFSYRDEEADSIGDVFVGVPNMVDVAIKNLDESCVHQLVSALLGSPRSQIDESLGDLVVSRTLGNPFHVIQFIETIQKERILIFCNRKSKWVFDSWQIKREMMVTETVCTLLSRRIRHLHPAMQEVLKVASLIGYSFAKSVLINVASVVLDAKQLTSDEPPGLTGAELVESVISRAASEGFIETTKNVCNFSHDKLQASFRLLVEPADLSWLHYMIGNQYVFCCQNEDSLFQAAVHLNKAGDYAILKDRRDKLARINLEAAKRCRNKSAFANAAGFLRHGLKLLNDDSQDKWTQCFDLSFELTENLAKMELILGNLAVCKEMNEELLRRSKSLEMKITPLVIDVEVRMAGNEMTDTIIAAKYALKELGIVMPHHLTIVNLIMKLQKVRRLVRGKMDEEILGLPLMRARSTRTAIRLLTHLSMYCLLQDQNFLAVYSALLGIELIMMKGGGLSPYSANCFSVYGIAELGLGNIHEGIKLGELAMTLVHRIPCREAECHAMLGIITLLHWKTSLCSLEALLGKALKRSFEVGDVVSGSLCVSTHSVLRYMMGENLGSLERSLRTFRCKLCDLGQDAMIRWIQPCLQYIVIMRSSPRVSSWEDLATLFGDVMDESEYLKEAILSNHKMMLMMAWTYKSLLAYNFGCYEKAETIYYTMESIITVYRNTFLAPPYHFFGAMVFYERYRTTRRVKHLKIARRHVKSLKRFETAGSPNVSAFVLSVEAELLSLKSADVTLIVSAYTKAINALHMEQLIHREALANERLGFVLHSLGCHDMANIYLDRALSLYGEWGAVAKYQWLLAQRSLHQS